MAFYEVKNIKKNFGSTIVLKGIDFTMEKGEVLAIIGSSGSGKTTLLRCMTFLEMPDCGTIALNGEPIIDYPEILSEACPTPPEKLPKGANDAQKTAYRSSLAAYRQAKKLYDAQMKRMAKDRKIKESDRRIKRLHFGLVFQSFNLFPHDTVLKNVTLADDLLCAPEDRKLSADERKARKLARKEKAVATLERVGLGDKLSFYPCQLSGGQQQRVAIARALALEPDILCFDEPTSALDPELTREVLRVIRDLKREGRTMIVVTHEMDFARKVADKVIFMADGVIEEMGTPSQVFDTPVSEKTKAFLNESAKPIDED